MRTCRFCGKNTKDGRVLCLQCRRPSLTTLRCTNCLIVKPIDKFYKSVEKLDGRRNYCKECYTRSRRGETRTYVDNALRIISLAVLNRTKRDLVKKEEDIRCSAQRFLADKELVRLCVLVQILEI